MVKATFHRELCFLTGDGVGFLNDTLDLRFEIGEAESPVAGFDGGLTRGQFLQRSRASFLIGQLRTKSRDVPSSFSAVGAVSAAASNACKFRFCASTSDCWRNVSDNLRSVPVGIVGRPAGRAINSVLKYQRHQNQDSADGVMMSWNAKKLIITEFRLLEAAAHGYGFRAVGGCAVNQA